METETMSDRLRVYLAGAFGRARFFDETIAPMLHARGLACVSSWHRPPWRDEEDLAGMPLELAQVIATTNDSDLSTAEAILVVASPRARETWCELTSAWRAGLHCVVVEPMEGTMPLAAYRPGVVRVAEIAEAVTWLATIGQARRTPTYPPPAAKAVG